MTIHDDVYVPLRGETLHRLAGSIDSRHVSGSGAAHLNYNSGSFGKGHFR